MIWRIFFYSGIAALALSAPPVAQLAVSGVCLVIAAAVEGIASDRDYF